MINQKSDIEMTVREPSELKKFKSKPKQGAK